MNWTENDLVAYMRRQLKDKESARRKIQEKGQNNGTDIIMGAVPHSQHQHDPGKALGHEIRRKEERKAGMGFRVTIVSFREKALDGDNLIAGAKFLRDAIAETIGLDDAEGSGIEWSYGQQLTRGEQGTIIMIERMPIVQK